jgi:hypothetical protein
MDTNMPRDTPTQARAEPGLPSFADDLKSWHRRMGYTRREAAEALCVPLTTYHGWCAGRPCVLEGTVRRLMAFLEDSPLVLR